jgi:metal-responsive CopG/Arc/MetJ family transcriptional regulator
MEREKFGVAVTQEIVDELDELVEECADLGASRSEIVEAILTAYLQSDVDHVTRVRELIIRRRQGNL